jgi:hypothetical protein
MPANFLVTFCELNFALGMSQIASTVPSATVFVFELREFSIEHSKNLKGLQRDQIVFAAILRTFFWFIGAKLHFRINQRELFVG